MGYQPHDHYYKKAKELNFAARSIFKLEEIDQRFRILRSNDLVLDLGAAPGSWSQYAAQKILPHGKVLGIDLQPVKLTIPNALFVVGDFRTMDISRLFAEQGFVKPFDVILSDMAPKTTGIKVTDQARSFELCQIAVEAADKYLKVKGHFVCKLFQSDDFETLRQMLKKKYKQVEVLRPKSTRKESKEIFLIGLQRSG
jgi:23S rRNA (uridine2552-2'-O)-methyltransferase